MFSNENGRETQSVELQVSNETLKTRANLRCPNPDFACEEIVINYHMLTLCNYECKYCFADWKIANKSQELHHDFSKVKKLLNEVARYFKSRFPKVRLNFAGGEPMLVKNLDSIIEYSDDLGFENSIITNGSRLSEDFIKKHAHRFKVFGVSVDSTNPDTNKKIGREKGKQLDFKKLIYHLNLLRNLNPKIMIKINTVVNQFNFYDESLKDFLDKVKPNKWKVLKVLPNIKKDAGITDKQWDTFLDNYKKFSDIWAVENNEDMKESYLMIDPRGCFFDNSKSKNYHYSNPILEVGVEKALEKVRFKVEKFKKRY